MGDESKDARAGAASAAVNPDGVIDLLGLLAYASLVAFFRLSDDAALATAMADKEALELVRSYYAIPEAQRRRLFDLARVLSDAA